MNEKSRFLSFEDLTRRESEESAKGRSSFYYRAHSRDYLQVYPGGTAVPVTEASVRAALVIEEVVPDKKSADPLLYAIRNNATVHYDGPMPGYCLGVHEENGQRYYCTSAPRLIKARSVETGLRFGERWPTVLGLMRRLLVGSEGCEDQMWTLLAALKLAVSALKDALNPGNAGPRRSVRPGQAVALVGPRACGKTFLFDYVITPLLGGRVVDGFKAFSADSEGFNGELLFGEVWKVDDRESSTDARVRRQFASNLKAYLYSGRVAFHSKYRTPVTITPYGRLFIMCNDTAENLRVLPDITQDIEDKIHLFRCHGGAPPMPTNTEEERRLYREKVAAELPWMAGELEQWTVPEQYLDERSGVKTYMSPVLLATLRRQDPEAILVELIHSAFESGLLGGNPWMGTAAHLQGALCHRDATNNRQASELLSWPRAAGTYLGRIVEKSRFFETEFGLRVRRKGQNKGVEWYEVLLLETEPSLI